ncbi:MAG: hypothetical protein KGQ46_12425 [Hyphomicrobiales bacterium]|nr:hypothetical protein [Hyphomicrobiales bacterium]MDE2113834.1 hypothetical protein [Hyphomicrobiales bacterium]
MTHVSPVAINSRDPATALCHGLGVALMGSDASAAPSVIHLLPYGPTISGRDGRAWQLKNPKALVEAFNAQGHPEPIDWEHGQHIAASRGEAAPASGWIDRLELRDSGIWGHVTWTDKASAAICAREYRFISPAFSHDAAGNVTALLGAGLVNRPNLDLTALNHQQETQSMNQELLAKLGLPETATSAEVLAAIIALNARVATAEHRVALNATPSLNDFVPRADYEVALNRATTLEAAAKAKADADLAQAIASAVDGAIAAGKVAPASRDYHVAACGVAGGLDRFVAFAASAPSLFTTVVHDDKSRTDATALNAEQKKVAAAMGISEASMLREHIALNSKA